MGDLVDRVTRKNQDLVSELPLTISAQYGLMDQNEFFDKRVASKDVSGYYLIENGEFAYNKSTSTDAPWGAVKRLDRYENGSQHLHLFRPSGIDPCIIIACPVRSNTYIVPASLTGRPVQ